MQKEFLKPKLKKGVNPYNYILSLFTSNDSLREWMRKPFTIENMAISTNAFQLCFFDKSLATDINECVENKKANVLSIIPKTRDKNFVIILDNLQSQIMKVPLIKDSEECEACGGEGEVSYEFEFGMRIYTKEGDCPICEGLGRIEKSGEEMVFDKQRSGKILNSNFTIESLLLLLKVAKTLDTNAIKLVYQEEANKASVFKIQDVEILVMPANTINNHSEIFSIQKYK